ncbi:MAG: tRNA pseudouridine(38-40) synthase TruA [Planctomycetia bacterium]|nr:tRNA pseudouridine(38-40) synthase TruA [Planctomycetia bacterium]
MTNEPQDSKKLRRIKLELCYDGTDYSGWQIQPKQPNVKTIQGELQEAIFRVVGERVEALGSGRTDSGVHAMCQVAAFTTSSKLPTDVFTRAINSFLPRDIRIWRTTEVPLDFHPIHDVVRKRYRYLASDTRPGYPFFRKYAWMLLQRVDLERMRAAAQFLLGQHDFSAFQTQGSPRKTTVRTVYDVKLSRMSLSDAWNFPKLQEQQSRERSNSSASVHSEAPPPFGEPELICFEIEANGFLYNMVRAIMGTLYLFGENHRGYERPEIMCKILNSCNRRFAGPTAPAHGLYMINVVYPSDLQEQS